MTTALAALQPSGITQGELDTALDDTFRKSSATDKAVLSGLGMPSARYVNMAVPAHLGTATMPANGYLVIRATTTTAGSAYVWLQDLASGLELRVYGPISGANILSWLPVQKGRVITVRYSGVSTPDIFRLIYAEGN